MIASEGKKNPALKWMWFVIDPREAGSKPTLLLLNCVRISLSFVEEKGDNLVKIFRSMGLGF
jgi:hypothetical protein